MPTDAGDHLRFLLSVNSKPGIEEVLADITVPCDRSIAGCVYNTGQLIAIANPDDFYQEVDQMTGLSTNIYMAIPVVDEVDVLGVATFVNRPEGSPQEPFGQSDIETAMRLSDLIAAGLRYYQRMALHQRLLGAELARCGQAMGLPAGPAADQAEDAGPQEQSPMARALSQLEKMSRREQDLAAEMVDVLAAYRES